KGYGENFGKEVPMEAPEYGYSASPMEGIFAKIFSPVYKSKNLTVLSRQSKEKYEREDSPGFKSQMDEWKYLFGAEPSGQVKKDKRKKSKADQEFEYLFGDK